MFLVNYGIGKQNILETTQFIQTGVFHTRSKFILVVYKNAG